MPLRKHLLDVMNPEGTNHSREAFTRADLIVVLAVLALLAAVTWPALANTRFRSQRVECLSNLRRIGQGFHVWADENGDRFPWQVQSGLRDAASCYQMASDKFGTPRFLACPADSRLIASSFYLPTCCGGFGNRNLSYFAGLHAALNQGRTWLAGDWNLTGREGTYCAATGIIPCTAVEPASSPRWDRSIHSLSGNLLWIDGSGHQVSNAELQGYAEQAASRDPAGLNDIVKPSDH